jgi:YihY family inner membrane protein
MNSATPDRATAVAPAPEPPPSTAADAVTLKRGPVLVERFWGALELVLQRRGAATVRYLTSTDSHTFAFAVAANAVLSFFPFVVLMLVFTRRLDHFIGKHFHLKNFTALNTTVGDLLRDYLPISKDYIVGRLDSMARAHNDVQIVAVIMLIITSTGVFLPLEVALNRIWGFPRNRSYLMNQIVSLGLAFGCGLLALLSVALTAGNQYILRAVTFGWDGKPVKIAGYTIMKVFAILASVAIFHLIYWLLPHGKVPARVVAPAAVITGIVWEASKYLYIRCLPLLDFQAVYGPFSISVTLIFWAFLSGLILLAGAHLSADGIETTKTTK